MTPPYATRQQEDDLAAGDRPDGRHRVPDDRQTHRAMVPRSVPTLHDWTKGIPILDDRVQHLTGRKRERRRKVGLETAYCAETVAVTYQEMGLLATDKDTNWFDPGKFWSGDTLPPRPGLRPE